MTPKIRICATCHSEVTKDSYRGTTSSAIYGLASLSVLGSALWIAVAVARMREVAGDDGPSFGLALAVGFLGLVFGTLSIASRRRKCTECGAVDLIPRASPRGIAIQTAAPDITATERAAEREKESADRLF